MNKKTINAIITKKMKEWWNSIEDEDLRKCVERETIVTGGAIASMLLNEKVTDYDVYLKTYDTVKRVAQYYLQKFNSTKTYVTGYDINLITDEELQRVQFCVKHTLEAVNYLNERRPQEAQDYTNEIIDVPSTIEDVYEDTFSKVLENEDESYKPIFLTTNAITLSKRIQIVMRFFGEPEKIHENYDYTHCTNYWTKKDGVVLNQPALECILNKDLKYIGSKYPICSMIRSRKFIQRGWKINAGQFVKMAHQISLLDLNDINILADQLTGVDVAYFQEVIHNLKEQDKDRVDSAYLIEILNKMF